MASLSETMRQHGRRRILKTFVLCVLGILSALPLRGAGHDSTLLKRLTLIERGREDLRSAIANSGKLLEEMAEINATFLAGLTPNADGDAIVRALNRVVFDHLELKATHDVEAPEHLFLSSVLDEKQGYCLGLAAVYLVLAEMNSLPLYAVATPTHVFLRYDDGTTRINIETFQRGAHLPDERYIQEHKIPDRSLRKGVFLRNLNQDEFLAQVHNNLGVIFSQREEYERAEEHYVRAIELFPRFPAALYNLGNDLLRQGDPTRATRYFNRTLRLYPTDIWALNNRGLAYQKQGKLRRARRDFEEALRIDPQFEPAQTNLHRLPLDESSDQAAAEVF